MHSVLSEIARLRNGKPIAIDRQNSNRYRLVVQECDGSKTSYYFSTPIYNQNTRKLIDLKFHCRDGSICATGSNTTTTISETILMENGEGACMIALTQKPLFVSDKEVRCGNDVILPTTNGVALKYKIKNAEAIRFVIEVGCPF